MVNGSGKKLTDLADEFLLPSNPTHRQYEALRTFFVDRAPSADGVDFYRDVRPEGGVVNLPENPERFRWSPSLVRSSVTNRPLSVISPTLDGGSTTRLGTLFLASY